MLPGRLQRVPVGGRHAVDLAILEREQELRHAGIAGDEPDLQPEQFLQRPAIDAGVAAGADHAKLDRLAAEDAIAS